MIQHLTWHIWQKICDTFYDKCLEHQALLGSVDKRTCEEYLAFYGVHKGLYWHEEDGKITGVGTVHPGKRDFDWKWDDDDGAWTLHCLWCDTQKAMDEMASVFFQKHKPVALYACRRGKIVELNSKKLRKIFTYGRRRNNNSSTGCTELRPVDEGNSGVTD